MTILSGAQPARQAAYRYASGSGLATAIVSATNSRSNKACSRSAGRPELPVVSTPSRKPRAQRLQGRNHVVEDDRRGVAVLQE